MDPRYANSCGIASAPRLADDVPGPESTYFVTLRHSPSGMESAKQEAFAEFIGVWCVQSATPEGACFMAMRSYFTDKPQHPVTATVVRQ